MPNTKVVASRSTKPSRVKSALVGAAVVVEAATVVVAVAEAAVVMAEEAVVAVVAVTNRRT